MALGWGVRRFDNNVYMLSNPTQFGESQTPYSSRNRAFAIHQIVLGWKAYKHYYQNDELPNPRPFQPKKK